MENNNPMTGGQLTQAQPPMTIGEIRVRTNFNVSGSDEVDTLKTLTAELINLVDSIASRDPRLASLSMTAFEEACMWAVKLATTPQQSVTGVVNGQSNG